MKGPLGSGKSTLARALSACLGWPILARTHSNLRAIAEAEDVPFVIIECRCPDDAIWRRRVEARQRRRLPAHHTVIWESVQRCLASGWVRYLIIAPHLIVDTTRPLSDLADEAVIWLVQRRR